MPTLTLITLKKKEKHKKKEKMINEITYEIASNKISYLIHSTYKMQVIIKKRINKDLLISFRFAGTQLKCPRNAIYD